MFILLQKEDLRDRMIRLFGSGDLHRTTIALDDAAQRLSRYFLAQLAINTVFGVVIGDRPVLIGVPSPRALGRSWLRSCASCPMSGPVIGRRLAAGLAAAVDPGWSMVVWTRGLFAVVEAVTGQVVEPLVYGHSTGLSPVAVVVAAIFWSWIWGPIGLILSTPLTLCLVVLGPICRPARVSRCPARRPPGARRRSRISTSACWPTIPTRRCSRPNCC